MNAISGKYTATHINRFWALNTAPELFPFFPNPKEVTESMAAFQAVVDTLGYKKLSDPDVTLIAVGDGHTPRTAALFAMRSKWTCLSVDPALRWKEHNVKRLVVVPQTFESIIFPATKEAIIVAVHSHAKLFIRPEWNVSLIVAIPCCVQQELDGYLPDKEYVDRGIWSPKNMVKIWDLRREK